MVINNLKSGFMRFVFLITISCILGCSKGSEEGNSSSEIDKKTITLFINSLANTYTSQDYTFFRNAWNDDLFKSRVRVSGKIQKSVLEYIYDKDLKATIHSWNIYLISEISSKDGLVNVSKIEHFNKFSLATFTFIYGKKIGFIRFRVEMKSAKPVITDFFDFRENSWYSEIVKNTLNLNSKFDAFSEERQQANISLIKCDKSLLAGDTISALHHLYEVPRSHWIGNGLSLRKLELANSINDSTYVDVLMTELEHNKSIYMRYVQSLYFDDYDELEIICSELMLEISNSSMIDSLKTGNYYWY